MSLAFYELNTITNFTFLTGASHPEEMIQTAFALGYQGLAITDECSLAGVVRAYGELKKIKKENSRDFKLIIGSLIKVDWQAEHDLTLILLCPCREAYAELSSLITRSRRRTEKGKYQVKFKDLSLYIERCLCIWLPHPYTNESSSLRRSYQELYRQIRAIQSIFGNRLWIGYSRLLKNDDYFNYLEVTQLSKQLSIPVVAQNQVLMHTPDRIMLQHCLTSIKLNTPIHRLEKNLVSNDQQCLRGLIDLKKLYPNELLNETKIIAAQCGFDLGQLKYEYPDEILPPGLDPSRYLEKLCHQGANKRWPKEIPNKIIEQINRELSIIKKLKYEHYFLTVYDIVQFAKNNNILCQGRGSAANSTVCYCLAITEVDPDQNELLFERFISEERDEPPDIDVDFEHQRREEVIQYIYKKYSRDRAALAATVITYRLKSAIRDVGKALDIDLSIIEHLSRSLAWWDKIESLNNHLNTMNFCLSASTVQYFHQLVLEILNFPRHLSQHVGGFIITKRPMSTLVPVENATMKDRTVIQWDKYDIETLGLLKVDVLGLGMLSMIRRCLEMTKTYSSIGQLADIPKEDRKTYEMLCNGDTVGVFQIESRAQMSMLPRLRPQNFYDLVIQIAIVRPGPIQGNMVHPFLKRRNGEIAESYPNQEIKAVLKRTLCVPIFQEQVIKLAMVAAGFSGGQADQLRRAMATWGRNGDLYQFKDKLINGMLQRGYPLEFAERLFEQMKGFGSYGFPESHSASFAILAYFSAWLKRHHTAAFYTALLNSQPMGFYTPSQLIQDARRHNIQILAIDIDHSEWSSLLVSSSSSQSVAGADSQPPKAIRLGFHLVKGFNLEATNRIVQQRKQSPFANIQDLVYRAQLNALEKEAMIKANCLPRLAKNRYQAQWLSLSIEQPKPLLTFSETQEPSHSQSLSILKSPTEIDEMIADYQSVGLTLNQHPMEIIRKNQRLEKCYLASQLKKLNQGQFVRIAGVVTCRQRPGTAAGVLFLTLEDETGNINVIVWKKTFEQFRKEILTSSLLMIKGTIERERKVIHVIAGHIQDISDKLMHFRRNSRDFH